MISKTFLETIKMFKSQFQEDHLKKYNKEEILYREIMVNNFPKLLKSSTLRIKKIKIREIIKKASTPKIP